MIRVYSEIQGEGGQGGVAEHWLRRYAGSDSAFVCVLGFTETGLIPGISAAGATPADRQWTAIADAEFLYHGPQLHPHFPLPPLVAGVSPTLISRAVVEGLSLPLHLFDAGLPHTLTVPAIALPGQPARCVSTGAALSQTTVEQLFQAGLQWGAKLAATVPDGYLILSECVVGGTTTALAVLTGLGWDAKGKVNSSHVTCNHNQKWEIVRLGLERARESRRAGEGLAVVAAVGDPMQVVVAGMAIAASQISGVLLAGGTQMLAVYALMQTLGQQQGLNWKLDEIVVGTTRWVTEDPTGDTVGLAKLIGAPLLATQLSFANARFAALRDYEQGFVKEGVGAGGGAIAAHLQGWDNTRLVTAIEALLEHRLQCEGKGMPQFPDFLGSVEWLPGSESINRTRQTIGQQPDNLCGPYWLTILLAAAGVGALDITKVACLAGAILPNCDPRHSVPPGAANRFDYSMPLPIAECNEESGTAVAGLLAALPQVAGDRYCLVPLSGVASGGAVRWSADAIAQLLQLCSDHPHWQAALLANGNTGRFWGSHPDLEMVNAYLQGDSIAAPPPDWMVGHFVTLAGIVRGSRRSLVIVRDTYPTLGWDGYHLQPLEAIAHFLNRNDGSEGGILVFAAKKHQIEIEEQVRALAGAIAVWDNGTPFQVA